MNPLYILYTYIDGLAIDIV